MDLKNKKKRGENWILEDKLLLQHFIREKFDMVENKNTDSNTNNRKMKAWKEIEQSFNQMASTKRTISQLKCQWNIMKILTKRKKAELFRTGEGIPTQEEAVSANGISAWLPNEFVTQSDKCLQETLKIHSPEVVISDSSCEQAEICETTENCSPNKVESSQLKREFKAAIMEDGPSKWESTEKMVSAILIAENEIKCRLALHKIQIENERKRARNLDLEHEILLIKIKKLKEN